MMIKNLLCIDNILQIENVCVENREGDDERQFVYISLSRSLFLLSLAEKRKEKVSIIFNLSNS